MARKPLSNALKVLYGIVSVPNLYWTIMFGAFGAFFITNILKLPASVYAVSQSAGNLISFFIVPVFAALINNGKPGRWGKVRKWTLIGPVIGIIFSTCAFLDLSSNASMAMIVFTIVVCGIRAFSNIGYMSNNTMIGLMGSTQAERAMLASHPFLYGNIGSFLFSISAMKFIQKLAATNGGNMPKAYFTLSLIIQAINLITVLLVFSLTKGYDPSQADLDAEQEKSGDEKAAAPRASNPSVGTMLKLIFTNRALGCIVLAQFAGTFVSQICAAMLIYIYNFVLEDPDLYSLQLTMNTVIGFVGSFIAPTVVKKLGNKLTVMLGLACQIVGLSCCWVLGMNHKIIFFIGWMVSQFGYNIRMAVNNAIFNDVAIYTQYKTKTDCRVVVVSCSTFASLLAALAKGGLTAYALNSSGYVVDNPVTAAIKAGLMRGLCLPCIIFAGIAFIGMLFYNLDNKTMKEAEDALAK